MLERRSLWLFALAMFCFANSLVALESDPEEDSSAVRTVKGVQFSVPADWPIETRNGATGPVPIEEYIARKFSKIEKRLATLEKKMDENKIEVESEVTSKKTILQSYEIQPDKDKGVSGDGEENVI